MALYTFRRRDLTLPYPADAAFFDEEMQSAALEAIEFFTIADLTPVVLDSWGEVNWVACDFAAKVRRVERSPLTAETYAREVDVFSRYLAAQHGKNLEDTTELELWAYRRYRLEGPIQTRVTQTTWNKIAAALLRLKRHLAIPGEIAWRAFRGGRDSSGGRVRMIGIEQFKEFREKGMRSSPRSPLRNVAFAELLVTTGIRCSEGAHLLVDELPQSRRFAAHSMVELHLPASITKGRVARVAHYSRRVANGPIRDYLDEERAHVAHRLVDRHFGSQHVSASSLARTGDWIFFESESDRARIVAGDGVGAVKPFSHFQPEERCRLVGETPDDEV